MNIFTKIIISTCILFGYVVKAQQGDIKIDNFPSTINQNYTFDGYWGMYNDDNTSNYKITGAKLTNNSTKTSENLYLDLFLVPGKESLDLANLPNKVSINARLGKLEPNGTSFNNIVVMIRSTDVEKYNLYELVPVLVLRDRITNNILNYKVLSNNVDITFEKQYAEVMKTSEQKVNLPSTNSNPINTPKLESTIISEDKVTSNDDTIAKTKIQTIPAKETKKKDENVTKSNYVAKPPLNGINVFDPIPSATPENGKYNPYVTVESSVDLKNINRIFKLTGIWKFEIDFEGMKVSIFGDDNIIKNLSFKRSDKLRLMLFFTKENFDFTKEVDGYDFVSFELDPMEGVTQIEKPIYNDNITKYIPAGEYSPLLILKELDAAKGEYVIKAAIKVGEKVKF